MSGWFLTVMTILSVMFSEDNYHNFLEEDLAASGSYLIRESCFLRARTAWLAVCTMVTG